MMIKHITLGTNEVMYYDYNGEPLPLRPISSFELDESFYNALVNTDEEIADLVVKLKLHLVKPKEEIVVTNKRYAELYKFYNNVDYWIVFYSMKDFQDEEFTKPDPVIPKGYHLVEKMKDIHKIATFILNASYKTEEIIKEIIRDGAGKHIATIVFHLNIPLAEFSKLTKLQRDFLILSKIKDQEPTQKTISISGGKAKLRKELKKVV